MLQQQPSSTAPPHNKERHYYHCLTREERHLGESPLGRDEQKYLDSILTPVAFNTLVASEHSFADLFTIFDQSFKDLRIFSMAPDGKVDPVKKNAQHAIYYDVIQKRMVHNQRVVTNGITDINDMVNMSVCFHWNQIGKISGYTLYTRLTDPDSMGEAIVLAFYHATLRRVVLLMIPGPDHRMAASRYIGKYGVVIPFDKACGWCGRAAENLKKCPCKGSRYCNAECQLKHWSMHKAECCGGGAKKQLPKE